MLQSNLKSPYIKSPYNCLPSGKFHCKFLFLSLTWLGVFNQAYAYDTATQEGAQQNGSSVTVSNIDATACAGFQATVYLTKKSSGQTYSCPLTITGPSLTFTISSGACASIPTLLMNDLGDKIGLEFKEPTSG
jgi:hypothetical protein